jgi:hypothetical protein
VEGGFIMRFIDLTGQKFGRLTVIKRIENGLCNRTRWCCKCDCGNEVGVFSRGLISGQTNSCGCYKRQRISETKKTHGMRDEKIYQIWKAIKGRCYNKNNHAYYLYGERGIAVCDRWRNSFESFLEDMGNSYSEGLTIERIDVNGNYEPQNCKWATRDEQQNNKRNNHYLTYNGKTQTMKQWADELGVNYGNLRARINRSKWPIEKALTTK